MCVNNRKFAKPKTWERLRAGSTAGTKALGQDQLSLFEERKEGRCGWNTMNHEYSPGRCGEGG